MATSPNFNWPEPDNTDLVKSGALAIRTAVNAIDTSLVDLKGGTTGQVLAKASNTDMDFTWAADAGAPESYGFTAGKNKIINGDFRVWQRGTTFTSPATNSYTADRWVTNQDGSGTVTISQQSFTPGTAPVAGYEAPFFLRQAVTAAGSTTFFQMQQKIEDVRTFANQTVTFSFWAKADSSRTGLVYWEQNFGSGGSATVQSTVFPAPALTTSWQRFTYTFTLPSISGKTIGTNSCLIFYIRNGGTASGANLDIWGAQLEAGSTATAFQTATGTIQGELAACQRYFWSWSGNGLVAEIRSASQAYASMKLPITMRTAPTATFLASPTTAYTVNSAGKSGGIASIGQDSSSADIYTFSIGLSGYTAGQSGFFFGNSGTQFSAEL